MVEAWLWSENRIFWKMQKDNRIVQHERTSFKVPHEREEAHSHSKPVTCFFFQPKSVPVVQPVVTGIDDGPSGSSMKPLTVSTSQKQLTFDIDVVINLFCGKTKSRNSMGIEVCSLTGQPIQQNAPRSSHRRCYVKKVFLEASQNSQ